MMKKARWVLFGVGGLLVLGFALLFAVPKAKSPRFLEKYPLLDATQAGITNAPYVPSGSWTGRPGGTRIYCFKGDLKTVAAEAQADLGPIWKARVTDQFALFDRGDETIIIRPSRSVVMQWPKTNYYGRYLISPEESVRSKIEGDFEGWITIDHEWSAEQTLWDRILNGPRSTVATPAAAPPAPVISHGGP